jgi:hypothetical protein
MYGFDFGRCTSGRVLGVLGTGLWLGLILSLARPAEAGVAQFYGFPGDYAANTPYFSRNRPAFSGGTTYSPSYSRPMVPAAGWPAGYYGAAPGAGRYSSWRSGGGGYDAGVFSSRPLGGGAYDSGLFSRWRSGGGAYDGGLFFGR